MLNDLWFFVRAFLLCYLFLFSVIGGIMFLSTVKNYTPCNSEPVKEEVKPNDSTASSGYYETMPIIQDVTTSKKWI